MTPEDWEYLSRAFRTFDLPGPVLELGAGYGGMTARDIVEKRGLGYRATDLAFAPGVDLAANFEDGEGLERVVAAGPFGTVLVLNVLEHTFDPIAVLDNVLRVTDSRRGAIVVLTPAVWPIHNYPLDYCRLLPDWYRRFAATRGLKLPDEGFQYVGYGPVAGFRTPEGQDRFPSAGLGHHPIRLSLSRVVHRLFNTHGRGMLQPSHVAVAGVFLPFTSPD